MAENSRSSYNKPRPGGLGEGVYLGKVVSHLDPTFMGGLKVTLMKYQSNVVGDDNQTYVVKAAPPFWGATPYQFMGYNAADFNDTQKSYGMWMIPPDIGVTVMCVFINGDPSEGYWIGCVPSRFSNHMVPGLAATDKVEALTPVKEYFDTDKPIPTGEINRRLNASTQELNPEKIKKPIHPIAYHFVRQGLLEDDVRGTTTSSARREAPSSVFGISTPGPLDRRKDAKRDKIGTIQSPTVGTVPVSRLGGTQFVMDDGDARYMRRLPAFALGYKEDTYVDVIAEKKSTDDFNIPKDEHFRIRTRTGHQILMHNSEDLIYIANSRGTAWIELTSNGKIDIFAEDSVSIHTRADMNFRADRDINLEAGRNINIKATGEYQTQEQDFLYNNDLDIVDFNSYENGRIQIESAQNFNLLIGRNGKIQCRNETEENGHLEIKVMGDMKISVRDPNITDGTAPDGVDTGVASNEPDPIEEDIEVVGPGLHIYSHENVGISTLKDLELNTLLNNRFTAGVNTDILSGGIHTETAATIHMNGPPAQEALVSEIALPVRKLPTYENTITNNTDGTFRWVDDRYQAEESLNSIMKRVPMHEPWLGKENLDPIVTNKDGTDREAPIPKEGAE